MVGRDSLRAERIRAFVEGNGYEVIDGLHGRSAVPMDNAEPLAELDALIADRDEIAAQLADALRILGRFEYLAYGATLKKDEFYDPHRVCPVCTWPEGGHGGPGRYKGNAENTHEAGCSMYAVLHGLEAPRIARDPLPETHPLARTGQS